MREDDLHDLSLDTEQIADEPQRTCRNFDWSKPAKKSSKQWYEQQDGSQVVWQAGDYSSREYAPFSAASKLTHT